jgi:carbon monoxide dehydrogenase subunit G
MKMNGTRIIAAPPETVWDALLDVAVLRDSVPGCKEMSGSPEDGFTATVTQKVGPVKATFVGAVALKDREAPRSLRLEGSGKGGPAGFASGGADVTLTPVEGGTELTYAVDAKVGGKLAQLGSRVVDAFAARMADQFFERFQARVEGGPTEADAPVAAPGSVAPVPETVAETETANDPDAAKKGLFKRILG